MKLASLLLGACAIGLSASQLAADEAARMADLSKSAFLEEYGARYARMLATNEELVRRFDPAYAQVFDAQTPITEAERASFECLYDAMAERDAIPSLARQTLAGDELAARAEADPDFDYADMLNPALRAEIAGMTPDDQLMAAMDGCGSMALTAERISFTAAFWADLRAAAAERGYVPTD